MLNALCTQRDKYADWSQWNFPKTVCAPERNFADKEQIQIVENIIANGDISGRYIKYRLQNWSHVTSCKITRERPPNENYFEQWPFAENRPFWHGINLLSTGEDALGFSAETDNKDKRAAYQMDGESGWIIFSR